LYKIRGRVRTNSPPYLFSTKGNFPYRREHIFFTRLHIASEYSPKTRRMAYATSPSWEMPYQVNPLPPQTYSEATEWQSQRLFFVMDIRLTRIPLL